MKANNRFWRRLIAIGGTFVLFVATSVLISGPERALGGSHVGWLPNRPCCTDSFAGEGEEPPSSEVGGAWYWLRSPEQEKRVVMSLFNRYCVRCHGVDGRGVWDIPDVPNFTNERWQALHGDGQLARSILEGRGSVMPPRRGTLSLEEAWAMARYLRTFKPGSEVSRPDFGAPEKPSPSPEQ